MENNEKTIVDELETVTDTTPAENVAEETKAPSKGNAGTSKLASIGAGIKEYFRKKIVNIKRSPHNIPFMFLLITSVYYLLCLNDLSRSSAVAFPLVKYLGLSVFVNILFSILVLVLFLNAFPKHPIVNKKTGKKHKINYVMLVLGFVFIAAMICFDVLFMSQLVTAIKGNESWFFLTVAESNRFSQYLSEEFVANPVLNNDKYLPYLVKSYNLSIAHIVLLGVTVVAYATLPFYKKLIMKINTSKELADNDIKEVIETED
ncbi:MAG: hypothetical protein ACI4VK_04870 [Candidatus Coproplasma sp.]